MSYKFRSLAKGLFSPLPHLLIQWSPVGERKRGPMLLMACVYASERFSEARGISEMVWSKF